MSLFREGTLALSTLNGKAHIITDSKQLPRHRSRPSLGIVHSVQAQCAVYVSIRHLWSVSERDGDALLINTLDCSICVRWAYVLEKEQNIILRPGCWR